MTRRPVAVRRRCRAVVFLARTRHTRLIPPCGPASRRSMVVCGDELRGVKIAWWRFANDSVRWGRYAANDGNDASHARPAPLAGNNGRQRAVRYVVRLLCARRLR